MPFMVLGYATRDMQRLGFLKLIVKKVVSAPSSNLNNIGLDLIDTVSRKINIKLNEDRVLYIKRRLQARVYDGLKTAAKAYLTSGQFEENVLMEIQDVYLADPKLPSQLGKLVKDDWKTYPLLGINLNLIRAGTFSPTTRAHSLLRFTSNQEILAFSEHDSEVNPFILNKEQSLVFLYSFFENDWEVVIPLMNLLSERQENFSEREAGDLLPGIFRKIAKKYQRRSLSIELRQKLSSLEQSASSIEKYANVTNYSSATAREEQVRVRLEPYVDIGILTKPDPLKYEYSFSGFGKSLVNQINKIDDDEGNGEFLTRNFFSVVANAWDMSPLLLTKPEEIIPYLRSSWKDVASSSGYAPIEEISVVAGINALVNENICIEIDNARNALITYQKANPYKVRFTVDRLGALAHVKFLD
jgi:hypothetical protein